jgi:hypothetical protein
VLISGGDYGATGIPSAGPRKAFKAVQAGLAEELGRIAARSSSMSDGMWKMEVQSWALMVRNH